jgi:outer membrane lipoprotein carrier protein
VNSLHKILRLMERHAGVAAVNSQFELTVGFSSRKNPAVRKVLTAASTGVLALAFAWLGPVAGGVPSPASVSIEQYVREFELSYSHVRTLQADFAQSFFAWGRTRKESGTVYLARGGKMRWVYHDPEEKIFLTRGKQVLLYLPGERQLRISSLRAMEDAPVPLDVLLSHIQLGRFFSRIEFADQALEAARGDRVIRGYPKEKFRRAFRSCLLELSPSLDVRKLVVFYPDNTTMQFVFSHIQRNVPLNPSLFIFSPPPGTEIIHQ